MKNKELRVLIAKALGWGFYEFTPTPANDIAIRGSRVYAFLQKPGFVNDEEYWHAVPMAEWPEDWELQAQSHDMPDWPNDLNAAYALLALPGADGYDAVVTTYSGGNESRCLLKKNPVSLYFRESTLGNFEAVRDTPAQATCTAFLMWDIARKAQNDQHPSQ